MLSHFLKTFFRNSLKNKWITSIIIMGLALGLACSLTILLWVRFEMTYDSFHINKDRIYQVQQTILLENQEYTSDRTGGAFGQALLEGFPEIESTTRMGRVPEAIMGLPVEEGKPYTSFVEENVWAVDSTFLRIFSFEPLMGNINNALKNKNSIVITRSIAEKYFGENWINNSNVLGTMLRMDNQYDLFITAVIENPPYNSNIQFDYLIFFTFMEDFGYEIAGFGGTMFNTYLLLNNHVEPDNINQNITEYIGKLHEPDIESRQFVVPLKKVHLYDEQRNYLAVYSFGAIGFFILVIACINYINLSTAIGTKRTKEIGVRKVGGANRHQLLLQFLGEAFILTLVSTQIAIILIEFIIHEFNSLAETNVIINYTDPGLIISVSGLIIFTTLLAGIYPAYVLSRQQPAQILKSNKIPGSKGSFLRQFLVVTQFSVTIFFIICTVLTIQQFRFMDTADLGFTKENIVFIPLRGDQLDNYPYIKTELLRSPDIEYVTTGSAVPGWVEHGEIGWGREASTNNGALARILMAGYDFTNTFDIEIVEGRYYSREYSSDSINSIVINEAIVEMLGYENPIGQEFYFWGNSYTIIGVVKNFSFFPFNLGGTALIMPFEPVENLMFVKLVPGSEASVMKYVEKTMASFNPLFPFEFYHLSDHHAPLIDNREQVNLLLVYFSVFGIFISCLGLYGLTIHIAEVKTKEIGIRKAFGASISGIMGLLSGGFLKLMIIANMIAIPFAFLAMNFVLQFFTIRINLSIWTFVLTALSTILLAILTISGKTIQAARCNPIESLKYE